MIDTILWDVDGTLLDFYAGEGNALRVSMAEYGVSVTDEQTAVYRKINQSLWEKLELNAITKETLGPERFRQFLSYLDITHIDPSSLNQTYQEALSQEAVMITDADTVCAALQVMGIRQYVVTNGTAVVQRRRLEKSGLDRFMEAIFISEELGAVKPERRFFDLCSAQIPHYDPACTMIVGDSLTSDIRGGNQAGICCCWFNPFQKPTDPTLTIDYEIRTLRDVIDCLSHWQDIRSDDTK